MNTLLLHIGMTKTGTTALQKFLYGNSEQLKQYGWCYPDILDMLSSKGLSKKLTINDNFNRIRNGDFLAVGEDGKKVDINGEIWKSSWNHILELLKNQNVVLSSEKIWTAWYWGG